MLKKNYPDKPVAIVKKFICTEGFEEHKLLPPGWLIRYRFTNPSKSLNVCIITDHGLMFESFRNAVEMMKESNRFTEQQILDIEKYSDMQRNKRHR